MERLHLFYVRFALLDSQVFVPSGARNSASTQFKYNFPENILTLHLSHKTCSFNYTPGTTTQGLIYVHFMLFVTAQVLIWIRAPQNWKTPSAWRVRNVTVVRNASNMNVSLHSQAHNLHTNIVRRSLQSKKRNALCGWQDGPYACDLVFAPKPLDTLLAFLNFGNEDFRWLSLGNTDCPPSWLTIKPSLHDATNWFLNMPHKNFREFCWNSKCHNITNLGYIFPICMQAQWWIQLF